MPSAAGERYNGFPLSGRPAERICRLMGWETEGAAYWTLTEHFDTLNALEHHQKWSVVEARKRWNAHLLSLPRTEPLVVVCLGRRAADAVGLNANRQVGEWLEVGLLQAVLAPHTSGRNREWNDPETPVIMKRILTEALERAAAL